MKYYWASKWIHFNWNKAADKAARSCCPLHWLDADLRIGSEEIDERTDKYRDGISLYGESTWTEEGYGWYDRDKPGGDCAGLSLDGENRPPSFSMPTKQKKVPLGVTHHTLFALHIVLLDCFVADQKQEEVIDIWRISMWREIQLYLSIILSIVIRYFFFFWGKQKFRPSFAKWRRLLPVCSCSRCRAAVSPGAFIHSAHSFP